MKDFNIAKYLKENNLGPHNILGAYVDLQPLKEEEFNHGQQESDEVPYVGADPKLDGFGDEFDQEAPVEEEFDSAEQSSFDRAMNLYGNKVIEIANEMVDEGYEKEDAIQFLRDMADHIESNVVM